MTRILSVILALLIQIVPLLRNSLLMVRSCVPVGWSVILKLGTGTVAFLGSYHAVSAATAISGSRTVDGTVGTPLLRRLATSGQTAHSWSADTAPRNSPVYPLTPGLFLTNSTGRIGGTPTQAATALITITAWENSGNRGSQISAVFTFRIGASAGVPGITRQPSSQTVTAGQNAAFTGTASGDTPLTFYWKKGLTVVSQTTVGTLTISNAQPADAGSYTLIVSNALAMATSAPFTLTVNPDVTMPILAVISPGPAPLTISSNTIRLTGTARDNVAISNVCVLRTTGGPILANGQANWAAVVPLEPGTNRLRVKALDLAGNSSGTNTLRTVIFVVTSPLTLSTNGDGAVAGATNGQALVVGHAYTLTATPRPGSLFSNWTGGVTSSTNVLRFVMQSNLTLTAQFVPNPFLALAGNHNGLYFDPTNIQHGSAGFVTVTALPTGLFSASLRNGIRKFAFNGRFDLDGHATNRVARPGTNALTVELNLDLQGGNLITGQVTDGTWSSSLTAHREVFQAAANPASLFATNYTLLMPGAADATLAPPGDGFASIKVDGSGMATVGGALGDGSPFAQRAPLSGAGDYPLYVSLYGGRGSLFGWLRLRPTVEIDLDGTTHWVRPPGPVPKSYTNGFVLSPTVQGSVYTRPGTNHALDLDTAFVGFNAGDLSEPFTNTVALGQNGHVANLSSNKLTMVVTPANGLFAGRATPPGTTRVLLFKGAILQRQGMGGGFFAGTNQFGHVYFGP